jgi:hypothetical protein
MNLSESWGVDDFQIRAESYPAVIQASYCR